MAGFLGAYGSTDPRRKFFDGFKFQKSTSNEALGWNLPTLVNQCRHLERTTATGRAIVEGFKCDVIGTGIAVEPDTKDAALNDAIRDEFNAWAECAGVDGSSLWELQAMAASEVAVAGRVLWRFVVLPDRAEQGHLPLAILPLEPEWLSVLPVAAVEAGASFCNGVEYDRLGRPIAYHLQDPAAAQIQAQGERVLAKYICDGFEKRRPFQSHGEPLMAPAVERIQQEQQLISTELHAAVSTAALAVAITSEYHPDTVSDPTDPSSEDAVNDIPLGATVRLFPGEHVETIKNDRPNQLIAAFKAVLRGDVAGACKTAQKWLTRDYSGATFMNARMEQLDSKRLHRATQQWLGRFVASRPYLEALPWIFLKLGRALPSESRARVATQRHKLLPDLPEYVDPLKDGQAAAANIANGLTTKEEECASRGRDYRKVQEQLKKEQAEQDLMAVQRIAALHLAIQEAKKKAPDLELDWSMIVTAGGAATAPGAYLEAVAAAKLPAPSSDAPAKESFDE